MEKETYVNPEKETAVMEFLKLNEVNGKVYNLKREIAREIRPPMSRQTLYSILRHLQTKGLITLQGRVILLNEVKP